MDLVMLMRERARSKDKMPELQLQVAMVMEMFETFREQVAPTALVSRDPNARDEMAQLWQQVRTLTDEVETLRRQLPPTPHIFHDLNAGSALPVARSPAFLPAPLPATSPPGDPPSAMPPPPTPDTLGLHRLATSPPATPEAASRDYSVPPPSPRHYSRAATPASPAAEADTQPQVILPGSHHPSVVNVEQCAPSIPREEHGSSANDDVNMEGHCNVGTIGNGGQEAFMPPVITVTPPATGMAAVEALGVGTDGNDMHVD